MENKIKRLRNMSVAKSRTYYLSIYVMAVYNFSSEVVIKVQSELSQQIKVSVPSGNPSGALLMQILTRGRTG